MTNSPSLSGIPLTPAPNFILLEPLEEHTQSQFQIADSAKQVSQLRKAKVLAVGESHWGWDTESKTIWEAPCKVGDTIQHRQWSNDTFKINGKEYKLIEFKDVMGVYNAR